MLPLAIEELKSHQDAKVCTKKNLKKALQNDKLSES